MKNIKLLNILIALIVMISACDKTYDDIYDDIEKQFDEQDSIDLHYSDKMESPETYKMVEDDYVALKNILLAYGSTYEDDANDIGDYQNFSEYIPAKTYIPFFLNAKYFSYTPGTEMVVTYNQYTGSIYEDVTDLDAYELGPAEYDMFAGPGEDDWFTSSHPADQYIPLILAERYPIAEEGTNIMVQYTYRGTHDEVYTELEFDGAVWTFTDATTGLDVDNAYELEDADYEAMGENGPGAYHNFSSYDPPEDYLPDWMLTKYTDAANGDKQTIIYTYYGVKDDMFLGFTKSADGTWKNTQTVEYNYDSGDYTVKTLSYTGDASSIFKFTTDEGWLFVPPLKFVETDKAATREYELTDADYELVGDGKYHNFTLSDGGVVEKITTILKANFNDLAIGDVFEVTYKGYDGGVSDYTIKLEVQSDE